jgi:hypothetical protein
MLCAIGLPFESARSKSGDEFEGLCVSRGIRSDEKDRGNARRI